MGRRLLRMTHQFEGRRLALPRRLATNLSISYIVSTTEDQVSSVSDGLSSTVATGIVDTLNTAIGDSSLNVTVHEIANFETPTVTAVSSTDVATDDSDDLTLKIGLTSFVIICVVGGTVFLLCMCLCTCLLLYLCRRSKSRAPKPEASVAEDRDKVAPVPENNVVEEDPEASVAEDRDKVAPVPENNVVEEDPEGSDRQKV